MSIIESIEALLAMAQAAQTSGAVPIGVWSMALAVLVVGSQVTLQSGALKPSDPVEINDIGNDFDAAMVRMRAALAAEAAKGA